MRKRRFGWLLKRRRHHEDLIKAFIKGLFDAGVDAETPIGCFMILVDTALWIDHLRASEKVPISVLYTIAISLNFRSMTS